MYETGTAVIEIITTDRAWAEEFGQNLHVVDTVRDAVSVWYAFPVANVRMDEIMGRPIVRVSWPSTIPADANPHDWATFLPVARVILTCVNHTHDHTTTVDENGDPCVTRAEKCNHCGAPALYDEFAHDYRHADGLGTDDCWGMAGLPVTPCIPAFDVPSRTI